MREALSMPLVDAAALFFLWEGNDVTDIYLPVARSVILKALLNYCINT